MLTELRTVCSLANRIFFLTLDRKTCLERRIQRIDYDPPDEPGYFEQVVWPAYQQHLSNALEMARETDRLTFVDVVNMDTTNEDIIDKLLADFYVDLVRIQRGPIDINDAVSFVTVPASGASSVFVGTTRSTFEDKKVVRLEYEAYDEMANKEMRRVCNMVRQRFPEVKRVAIIHRIGVVAVGEASVVIATSAPHRGDAIRATEAAIDELKRRVPIWKKVLYFL
ncbi:unnamed protein product [Toxocara canis]|uniref:Molybdopterin synthase catalytic subunit n=1 Tax=Toxocara canis TaxID=6265 RepID=A0A183TYR1_TOXCA|nr:unnamed protein product [Toxocara canis]